jgi:molecular chaperone DnaK
VTFDIDNNGVLNVSAKDLGTGKEQKVRVEASSGLSEQEVERMRREAEAHAEEDRRRRELIEARNQADQLVYQVEKTLQDNAALYEGDKAPVQAAIAKVREVMNQDDISAIRRAVEDLRQASQAMAQHTQSRQAGGATAQSSGDGRGRGEPQGQGQDDVIDAEFEVKK